MEILEVIERQMYEIKKMLMRRYGKLKPVHLLMTIPGIGFLTALTLYAEICDIRRFSNPGKLARYCALVPRVYQSSDVTRLGKEMKGNRGLKCVLIEAAWSHLRFCPDGRLAKVFENAYRRKRDKKKAIKIVASKLVNVIWAVWTYEREFMVME